MKVRIKKLTPFAVIPSYTKPGDAGMDLTITDVFHEENKVTYGFGIALEIPEGFLGLLFPRSSVRDYPLTLSNSVGVIDSTYRGEVKATFHKLDYVYDKGVYIVGDRGAQLIIIPYPPIEFEESSELSETERGVGGFGSSGK